jgi:hypothetical protein
MSLINVRNLSAPIRSKVQIGGLIIVALLVLVIRYGTSSGGSRSSLDRIPSGALVEDGPSRDELLDLLDEPAASRRPSGPARDDSMVDELVDGRFDRQQKQKRQEADKNESFQDIRRSLGLE